MPRLLLMFGLLWGLGCASGQPFVHPTKPVPAPIPVAAPVGHSDLAQDAASPVVAGSELARATQTVIPAGHTTQATPSGQNSVARIDSPSVSVRSASVIDVAGTLPSTSSRTVDDLSVGSNTTDTSQPAYEATNSIDLNLPSVLSMIDSQHPAVGLAQWRVQEAYAQLARAEVMWLPSIQAGFSFHRHDGNYQASNGAIVDVNRNSFQYGLGTGAVGAGTTPRPGLVAQFHVADAIFQPEIAEKTAWARGHAAKAVINERLLNAATAYLELVDAHQDARILEESQERTSKLHQITSDFAAAGEGLQADADRLQTELMLVKNRTVGAGERTALASARLAQAISLDAGCEIVPLDITAVPLELVNMTSDKSSLISTGLGTRPELKESQALVAAACEAYRREKYAPFVPSVLLGLSTSGFGGGLGSSLNDVDGRYDLDALMSWEVRNLGFGERAARRESSSRVQQAKFEKLRVLDQVAREVSDAYSQVRFRSEQIAITERAIQSAESSYELNLARIRDGQGLPLEVLQSIQALETARRTYLRAVIDHNQAQFRLQWALGWPVSAPATFAPGI